MGSRNGCMPRHRLRVCRFAFGTHAPDMGAASASAIATGTHTVFAVAAALVFAALPLAMGFAKPRRIDSAR